MKTQNPKAKPKERVKFYELTKLEKEAGQIQDIYRRIDMQEKYMEDLLIKYNIGSPDPDSLSRPDDGRDKQRSRTIDAKSARTSLFSQRQTKQDKIGILPIQLPTITSGVQASRSSHKKVAKRRGKRKDSISISVGNQPLIEAPTQMGRQNMKAVLRKAYLNDKASLNQKKKHKKSQFSHFQHSPSQQVRTNREIAASRVQSDKLSDHLLEFERAKQKERLQDEKEIPLPVGYFARPQEEEESSDEEGVPLTYYQKQYRGLIRNQCLQETNFLYFSKNESMQNWTEGLLLLFEKHDKQLAGLRKRCKYLQKFDDTFFSIDIFKND